MKEQVTNMMLKDKQGKFTYLTGLTTNEFYCLYECLEQFLYLITYPDFKDHWRSGDKEQEVRHKNWYLEQYLLATS